MPLWIWLLIVGVGLGLAFFIAATSGLLAYINLKEVPGKTVHEARAAGGGAFVKIFTLVLAIYTFLCVVAGVIRWVAQQEDPGATPKPAVTSSLTPQTPSESPLNVK